MQFSVKLSTGEWSFYFDMVDGLTCYEKTIHIRPTPKSPKNELDTWIHEASHAILPGFSEKEIQRVSQDLTAVLWRAGYRKIK